MAEFTPIHLFHLVVPGEAVAKKTSPNVSFPGIYGLGFSRSDGSKINGLESLFNAIADAPNGKAQAMARAAASRVKPIVSPPSSHRGWHARAMREASMVRAPRPALPEGHVARVQAVIYMGRGQMGDLINFEEAIWDLLQDAELIANDYWVNSHEGSERRWTDPDNPRVEVDVWDIGPRVVAPRPTVRVVDLSAASEIMGPLRFVVEHAESHRKLGNCVAPRGTSRDALVREASRLWQLAYKRPLPDGATITCRTAQSDLFRPVAPNLRVGRVAEEPMDDGSPVD